MLTRRCTAAAIALSFAAGCTGVSPEAREAANFAVLLDEQVQLLDRAAQSEERALQIASSTISTGQVYGVFMGAGNRREMGARLTEAGNQAQVARDQVKQVLHALRTEPLSHAPNQVTRDNLVGRLNARYAGLETLEAALLAGGNELSSIADELERPCDPRGPDFYGCIYRRQTGGRSSPSAQQVGKLLENHSRLDNLLKPALDEIRIKYDLSDDELTKARVQRSNP